MDALKKHLIKIATDRQTKLRAELGEEGYRAHMRTMSLKAKRKRATKRKLKGVRSAKTGGTK